MKTSHKPITTPGKKGPSDVTTLSDIHLKTLRRCRAILSKDLDPVELLDALHVEDVPFKHDLRDVILSLRTREARVAMLLDRFEASDERTFSAFMTATREHYRHVHCVLEETIKTLEGSDGRVKELTQIEGGTIRRILKDAVHRQVTNEDFHEASLGGDPGDEIRSDDEPYLNCYVVATRGKLTREKWIKHSTVSPVASSHNSEVVTGVNIDGNETETGYMAVTNKDVTFRILSRPFTSGLHLVGLVPESCQQIYVVDDGECRYSLMVGYGDKNVKQDLPPGTEPASLGEGGGPVKHKRSVVVRRKLTSETSPPVSNFIPPPLPPKPNNLPVVVSYPNGGKHSGDESYRLCIGDNAVISREWSCTRDPDIERVSTENKVRTTRSVPVKSPPVPVRQLRSSHSSDGPKLQPLFASGSESTHNDHASPNIPDNTRMAVSPETVKISNENNDCNVNNDVIDDENIHINSDINKHVNEVVKEGNEPCVDKNDCNVVNVDSGHVVVVDDEDCDDEDDDISLNYNVHLEESDYPYESVDKVNGPVLRFHNTNVPLAVEEFVEAEINAGDSVPLEHRSTTLDATPPSDNIQTNKSAAAQLSLSSVAAQLALSSAADHPQVNCDSSAEVSPVTDISVLNPRDSGVGSALSHGFSDFSRRTEAVVPKDKQLLSASLGDLQVHATRDDGDKSSSSSSYYEDIELVDGFNSPSIYLDPQLGQSQTRREGDKLTHHQHQSREYNADTLVDRKVVPKGYLFIIIPNKSSSSSSESQEKEDLSTESHKQIVLGYDKDGMVYQLPCGLLKRHGDPTDENWFYPVELSAKEASLFLARENQAGCFMVYRPTNRSLSVLYHLSVCRADGLVVHYRIIKNSRGDVAIEGHDHSFMTVHDLVKYFRKNQSRLATRLRRSLKEATLPITPGYHYPQRLDIPRSSVKLSGKIIGQGKFGALCEGQYRGAVVTVKVLQRDPTSVEEDDFLEEAIVMSNIRHDNIVKLVGVCCSLRPFYIVTEFFERGSLKGCLKNNDAMLTDDVDVLFDVCIQTVSAMAHLESLQFVLHRDVSACNFLLTNDMLVKLTNFERARSVADDDYQACPTDDVIVQWAAPEVLTDSVYSTKSDVWSLGIVFWEVFSRGADPYSRLELDDISSFVVGGGLLEKPLGCPHELYVLMKSCWAQAPNARPSFASLSDKIKGKSNAYYASVVRDHTVADKVTSNVSTRASVPLPTKFKSPTNHRLVTSMIVESSQQTHEKSPRIENGTSVKRGLSVVYPSRTDLGPTSSSDSSSIISASIADIGEREDLTRGDKIRKSIRKLIRKKTPSNASSLAAKHL